MRALIDMDEKLFRELDDLARQRKQSRAALIREAVSAFLADNAQVAAADAFGLWGNRKVDGLAYQEKVRREW